MSKQEVPKPLNPYAWKMFMTIFKLFEQFFFQNNVSKIQEDFSELGIRVFVEDGPWKFPGISYLTDLRQTRGAKKILKTV
jgi:hypothetical protein